MPSKKGQRIAARHAQIHQRARHRAAPALTEAQLRGSTLPAPASAETSAAPKEAPQDVEGQEPDETATTAAAPAVAAAPRPAAAPPLSLRSRREQQAIAAQAGPKVVYEFLRIGIITSIIGGVLIGLKFGTDLGA